MEREGWIWNMKSVDLNFFSVMTQEYYNHCVAFVPGFLFYLFLHWHICEDIYIMHEHKVTQQTLLPTFSHESCWLIVGEAPRKAALQQQTSGRGRLQLANMDVNTATLQCLLNHLLTVYILLINAQWMGMLPGYIFVTKYGWKYLNTFAEIASFLLQLGAQFVFAVGALHSAETPTQTLNCEKALTHIPFYSSISAASGGQITHYDCHVFCQQHNNLSDETQPPLWYSVSLIRRCRPGDRAAEQRRSDLHPISQAYNRTRWRWQVGKPCSRAAEPYRRLELQHAWNSLIVPDYQKQSTGGLEYKTISNSDKTQTLAVHHHQGFISHCFTAASGT